MKKDLVKKNRKNNRVVEKSKKIKKITLKKQKNEIIKQEYNHQYSPFQQKFSYLLKFAKQQNQDLDLMTEFQKKQPFTLLEDIKILYQVMSTQDNPFGVKLWKHLEENKIFKRTFESLRDRYRKYLKFLSDENLQEIFEYTQQEGYIGFLDFKQEQNMQQTQKELDKRDIIKYIAKPSKYLVGIFKQDPRLLKSLKLKQIRNND